MELKSDCGNDKIYTESLCLRRAYHRPDNRLYHPFLYRIHLLQRKHGKGEKHRRRTGTAGTTYSDRNWLFQLYGSFARNKNTIVEISQAMRDYNKRVEELFSGYNPESSSDSKYAKTYLKYYEGASLTSIYGMKSLGISPTNGKEIYLRRNGDVTDVWSADEWTIIGDTAPKGQGSFGYTLSYKQLSMFASFLYTFGGDAYNNTLVSYVENADIKNDNVDKRVLLDRWQKPGDITTMKDIRDRNVTTGASSRFVQKTIPCNGVH